MPLSLTLGTSKSRSREAEIVLSLHVNGVPYEYGKRENLSRYLGIQQYCSIIIKATNQRRKTHCVHVYRIEIKTVRCGRPEPSVPALFLCAYIGVEALANHPFLNVRVVTTRHRAAGGPGVMDQRSYSHSTEEYIHQHENCSRWPLEGNSCGTLTG